MPNYHNLLSCWHKLEHYTPAALPKESGIQRLKNNTLPWNENSQPSKPNITIIFTVYLGVFQSSCVTDFVKEYFKDDRRGENDGNANICYASFKLNIDGRYINESLGISTLPWALGQLENNQIANNEWDKEFTKVQEKVLGDFQQELQEIQTVESLREIQDKIIELSGWSIRPTVEIFIKQEEVPVKKKKKNEGEEESASEEAKPDLLNSFYIKDLETIIRNFDEKKSSKAFINYLKGCLNLEFSKNDLAKDITLLQETLLPNKYPDGCWPSEYKLSLMQQFAVNRVMNDLSAPEQEGLFSVNGPPGTGKTTLLRDIIAAILVKRAKVMASYKDPVKAFKKIGEVELEGGFNPFIYQLDQRLAHCGIVVASSNNGAVENISKELPLIKEVKPYEHISYFREVTESCIDPDYWGLISVVLGNKDNREKMVNSIWWKKEGEEKQLLKDFLKTRIPTEWEWQDISSAFQKKQTEVADEKRRLSKFVEEYKVFREVEERRETIHKQLAEVKLNYDHAETNLQKNINLQKAAEQEKRELLQELSAIKENKPGFFAYWLNRRIRNEYNKAVSNTLTALNSISDKIGRLKKETDKLTAVKNRTKEEYPSIQTKWDEINSKYLHLHTQTELAREELGNAYADAQFWENIETKQTQESCPWYSDKLKVLQSELFVLAMQVNELFILYANAKSNRILTSLSGFFEYLKMGGGRLSREQMKAMWDVFFLVIPVVSTTFASVQRMFEGLEDRDLPWLFIDEAGQAVPQAAAGAIWRSQRVVVVGDPFQIEPVVTIPAIITDHFSKYFELNESNVHSELSVQSMADRANSYGWYANNIWIGTPLRVHRRCIEPMFSIANRIAYNGMMFNSTFEKPSKVNFQTAYLSIAGSVDGRHYVPEQAAVIRELLLNEIRFWKGLPDVFVISPFTEISRKLKWDLGDYLRVEASKFEQTTADDIKDWMKTHIGTVHTFQGKQADGVILCLGLDENSKGAASWASAKPNLLNVALTRAKYRFIAIGDKGIWLNKPYFGELGGL